MAVTDSQTHDDAEVTAAIARLSGSLSVSKALVITEALRKVLIGSMPCERCDQVGALVALLIDTLDRDDLLVESEAVVQLIRKATRKRLSIPEPK